jgi:CRISPR-associated protein Cas4
MSEKSGENQSILKEFVMNPYQLSTLRHNYPKMNLYSKPIIGTEEIRQYSYCKRKIFFRYVLNGPMRQTYKMKYGTEEHETFQKKISQSEEYIQKYYNIYLTAPKMCLVGLIDYFIFNGIEAFPVEIKTGNIPQGSLENPDKMQVSAQAILIENNFDFLVNKVRVYYSKPDKIKDYSIYADDKIKVIKKVEEIQSMIKSENIPERTPNKNRCRDCECNKYCLRA